MILTRIQIENYKQYQGSHDIDVPSQATIGVIGENGAGKTTLFEAIEWCLYSPRSISPTDVRPRGFTGPTTVTVFLESVDGSQQYIVQRVLKRTPTATIFRVDPAGEPVPIVQGARQVSDYVASKLIGLSHTAFTATFFTRQKELHLFGDQAPGKRREEVGRLLGLETIRTAQRSIITDKGKAAAEARALLGQYERESEGRDFVAEIESATIEITSCSKQLETDAAAIAASEAARIKAETAIATVQERRDRDVAIAQQLGQLDQERQSLERRLVQMAAELTRLAARERERAKLAPLAATANTLQQQIDAQEKERIRFEQRAELDRTLRHCTQRQRELNGSIREIVGQVQLTTRIDGWLWSNDDALNAVAGATRLMQIVDGVDPSAAERREKLLHIALKACTDHEAAVETYDRFQRARAELDKQEQVLLREGDPADRLPMLEKEREQLLHDRTTLHANHTALEGERDKKRMILANIEQQQFGDGCPTCGRPFSDSDALIVTATLRQSMDEITRQIEQNVRDSKALDRKLEALDDHRKRIHEEMSRLDVLRKRLQKSVTVLEAQQETVDAANASMRKALDAAGLDRAPSQELIVQAERETRQLRQLGSTRATIKVSLDGFSTLDAQVKSTTIELETLGTITFDPAAFQKLRNDFREADRAHVTIAQIEHDLARRPDLISERDASLGRVTELKNAIDDLQARRNAHAFDPAELTTAQATLQAAQADERAAVAHFHRAQTTLREAEMRRESVAKEQQRLERLAKLSDAKRSEADHLDFIAREFTEFERFAGERKRPILSDYTSQLVRNITDGKYERVDFDQDFGIIVFDGEDTESSYDVDTFSGGERDAITLAARIALSQMIGRQAANPPGFLVLDEVFGSLDTDRRSHLLDLLGSISGTFDELRQVFIISHVDDVRTSPVLDELWRIEESAEGSSTLTSLSPGAEIDSL